MATYTVAASGGDFANVAAVNAASLTSGDIVQFNRGETFSGTRLVAVAGVTYQAYGTGAKPILSGSSSDGILAHNNTTFTNLRITNTVGPGIYANGKDNITISYCDLDNNVTSASGSDRALEIYGGDGLVVTRCTISDCPGDDLIYTYDTINIEISHSVLTKGTGTDGDCIQISKGEFTHIHHNTLTSTNGGKGVLILNAWISRRYGGATVENNYIEGGQFGIAPGVDNAIIRKNHIKNVGRGANDNTWASGIWFATGSVDLDREGIEVYDNVIENCPRAFGSWNDFPARTTQHDIRNNVIIDATTATSSKGTIWGRSFNRDNGTVSSSFFRRNIIVDSGTRQSYTGITFTENYYYNVSGQTNSGADPGLDADWMPTHGDVAATQGLSAPFDVGPTEEGGGSPTPEADEFHITGTSDYLRATVSGCVVGESQTTTAFYRSSPNSPQPTNIRLSTKNTSTWGGGTPTGGSHVTTASTSWQRLQVTWTQVSVTTNHINIGTLDEDGNGDSSCVGKICVTGVQHENNALFPSTYIRSDSGSTTTRGQDILTEDPTEIVTWNTTAFSTLILARTAPGKQGEQTLYCLDSGSAANRYRIWRDASGYIKAEVRTGDAQDAVVTSAATVADDTDFTVAVTFNGGNISMSLNGAAVVTDTGTAPAATLTTGRFGHDSAGNGWFGCLQRRNLYQVRTDEELIALEF